MALETCSHSESEGVRHGGRDSRRVRRRSAILGEMISEDLQAVVCYRRSSNAIQRSSRLMTLAARAWTDYCIRFDVIIDGYPHRADVQRFATELHMERVRVQEDAEHRLDKRTARNVLVQMEMFLWPERYPAYRRLSWEERREYWQPVRQDHNHDLLSAIMQLQVACKPKYEAELMSASL